MHEPPGFPLQGEADRAIAEFARFSGSERVASLSGATLLTERAQFSDYHLPGLISAGGGCRLFQAADDWIALNLARDEDRELLPALFETEFDPTDKAIALLAATHPALPLVDRGRMMGLAIAAENEPHQPPAIKLMAQGRQAPARARPPVVIDLSALWAGPLCAHLLGLAGASIVKVENPARPDGMRRGEPRFFNLLNQGKQQIALNIRQPEARDDLLALIRKADIVIESSRPRALAALGVNADALVSEIPGLIWISITAHGSPDWVGFGDDVGVAAGLSAELFRASGQHGFAGDAIADPMTGIRAAREAWQGYVSGQGGRIGVSMRGIVAEALASARTNDQSGLHHSLRYWREREGAPFPSVSQRPPC